jgi:hypothetical protein
MHNCDQDEDQHKLHFDLLAESATGSPLITGEAEIQKKFGWQTSGIRHSKHKSSEFHFNIAGIFCEFVSSDELVYVDDVNNRLVIKKLNGAEIRECELPNAGRVSCFMKGTNLSRFLLIGYEDGNVEVYDG